MSVFEVILVRILPAFFRIRNEFGEIFSPNTEKCGKNADQNNSEYGHFLCSVDLLLVTEKIDLSLRFALRNC